MKIDQVKRFLAWLLFICFVILSAMWFQSCGYKSPTGSNYNANSNGNNNRNGNGY